MSSATSPPLPGIPSSPEVVVARPEPASGRGDLARLCAAGFVAYCSYAICRAPLLPLFARELGAGPAAIGLVVGASTVTGIFVKMPAGALLTSSGVGPCSWLAPSCSRSCHSPTSGLQRSPR